VTINYFRYCMILLSALGLVASEAYFAMAIASDAVALEVTRAEDDGRPGSLRWAIEQSGKSTGPHIINLKPRDGEPLVIRLRKELPPITMPVEIRGNWTKDSLGAPQVILDGSLLVDLKPMESYGNPLNCPGVVPGTYGPNVRATANAAVTIADTGNVRLSGFEIRNFCIGVLSLRSHDNVISNMRFENNLGGAAVLLSGDDGTSAGGPTAGTGRHIVEDNIFLNNSDSIDLARGDRGTILRRNWIVIDGRGPAAPSSGVEICCDAHEATIEDNYLAGFAEALQIGGNGHRIRGNVLENNAVALAMQGKDNVAEGNVARGNRAGIVIGVHGSARLSRNLSYDNGRDISACAPGTSRAGVCHQRDWDVSAVNLSFNGFKGSIARAKACDNDRSDGESIPQSPKLLSAKLADNRLTVRGYLEACPGQDFSVELFAGEPLPSGAASARLFLATVQARTNEHGAAEFVIDRLPILSISGDMAVTAIATDMKGHSSELASSQPIETDGRALSD